MTLFKTLIFAGALALGAAETPQTFTGIITDTKCGADYASTKALPDADCVRECVRSGNQKFVLHDGQRMYVLSDQRTPAKYAAQHVKVTGQLFEKTGIIKVDKIEPFGDAAKQGSGDHGKHSGHNH